MAERRYRHYKKQDYIDLNTLEIRCNKHESNLSSKLIWLGLALNENNDEGTGALYERASNFRKGGLIFVKYDDDDDARLKTDHLLLEQSTPVLPGDAPHKDTSRAEVMLGNDFVKILVFRKR